MTGRRLNLRAKRKEKRSEQAKEEAKKYITVSFALRNVSEKIS